MSNLRELRRLLGDNRPAAGRVAATHQGGVVIVTEQGVQIITAEGRDSHRPGDPVRLEGGLVKGGIKSGGTRPLYWA